MSHLSPKGTVSPKKGTTVKVRHSTSCGSAFTGPSDFLVKNKLLKQKDGKSGL